MATAVAASRRATAVRLAEGLSEDEFRRLCWLHGTLAARTHLGRRGLPTDLDACRHLAFGLWLKASGRLDAEFAVAHDQ